ncbi:MAG: DUF4390 domain-containing protein [Deltaproteobacteria bacterium]|nr:DUF4390 domain-containing protein [Deltaproteobacteria bacterium]
MVKKIIKISVFIFAVLSMTHALEPLAHGAHKASIGEVVVVRDSALKLSFVVRDAMNNDIEEAIKNSIPTSFTFTVKVNRKRGLWRDKNIGKWKFNHTVSYDSLKDEYEVYHEETGKRRIVKDFNQMVDLMVTGKVVSLTPMPRFKDGDKYILKIKAKLDTVKLPFHLDHILLFVKLWDFETPWYTYEFTS